MKNATLLILMLLTANSFSQRLQTPTLSPFSKTSQEVGLSEITLEYARPSAKGRVVFGNLVPFDQIWRTGANASTKITLLEKAEIGGNAIAPGTYALYTIPGKEKWTIIIHSNTKMRSLAGDVYDAKLDVFRFEVKPQTISNYTETFTLQFANLQQDSCTIQLLWENTLVNIPISMDVDKKIEEQLAEFMKNPEAIPHRTFFQAAQYYLNANNLTKADHFIGTALEKSTTNFRYGLLKAKIQFKAGNKKEALNTIDKAHEWAINAKSANYIQQTKLFKESMLKK